MSISSLRVSAYVFLVLITLIRSSGAQHCWFPDGSPGPSTYTTCNATSTTGSACCDIPGDTPDICTTSGLCVGHAGFFYRGGCTDRSFNPEACATVCVTVQKGDYSNLLWCADSQTWCCAGTSSESCCDDDDLLIDDGVDWGYYFAHTPTASSSSSSSTPSATQSCSSTSTTSSSDHTSNLSTTIGAAVGAPLGALALGILFWLFWKEKRKSQYTEKESRMSTHPPVGYYNRESARAPDAGARKDQHAHYTEQGEAYQSPPYPRGRHELPNRIPELSE